MNLNAVKFSLAAFGGGLLLAACGDDVTQVTQETSGMEVVSSADSLGKCTEERSGEMKFASKENAVFVCADSTWKNVSAAKKASCSAESLKDSSGFKIVCDGDSVGVIFNGKDGSDGENGEVGAAGTYCTVEESPLLDSDLGRGGYQVVCGGEIVGTIRDGLAGEGCTITDNGDGTVTQDCGASEVTLYKAFCGGKPFDLDSSFCYEDSVVPLCGGESYDLSESFCFGNSIYALCGGKSYDLQESVCHEDRLFGFFEDSRDGRVYRTVQIGTQTWMAENLNYAYMPDTSSFCYNNSADSCAKYGRLYTWAAAMDSAARFSDNGNDCGYGKTCFPTYPVRGACPEGWHLPDTTEWNVLEKFVADFLFGGNADSVGYALKSASGWNDYEGVSGNGSDIFGFGALPAGYPYEAGTFDGVLEYAFFWSSTGFDADPAFGLRPRLRYDTTDLLTFIAFKDHAMSVRCVKD